MRCLRTQGVIKHIFGLEGYSDINLGRGIDPGTGLTSLTWRLMAQIVQSHGSSRVDLPNDTWYMYHGLFRLL
jgi:hypothetical protein